MYSYKLSFLSFLAVVFIYASTTVAWFILGGALTFRSDQSAFSLNREVESSWGPKLVQKHPQAWYQSPTAKDGRSPLSPSTSRVQVDLEYEPLRKGLFLYRTYSSVFEARYSIPNPTPIEQTVYVSFDLPAAGASYNAFTFELEGAEDKNIEPKDGRVDQATVIPANGSAFLRVAYHVRGLDRWDYDFGDASRVQDFQLRMETNFNEIDFPRASPTQRDGGQDGWTLLWDYPDVIGAQSIGMEMPKVLNAGPVASRISFFAPVSLLFFFAVLFILGAVSGINLHPMNFFFLAAGCFAFQLLFAYTVDMFPITVCFVLSALVSVLLVCGYLHAVAGWRLTKIALPAQFAYMVLFSYSFFFDGLSGLTITIGAILTLAILMVATAKTDWSKIFVSMRKKRVIPVLSGNPTEEI
ncbi:MAG: inner membrane CreD family protein [Verrucomicrobiota bacterium]